MNVFTATARIGADAEQRYTPSGDSVVSFNAAVDSGFGDKKVTTWVKCSLWGKRGESVLPYLKKGGQVAISGELANRKWQDKDGQDRYSLEVRLNDVTLIGGKPEGGQRNQPAGDYSPEGRHRNQPSGDYSPPPKPETPTKFGDDLNDDIPW